MMDGRRVAHLGQCTPASPLPLLLLEYKVDEFEMMLQKACGL